MQKVFYEVGTLDQNCYDNYGLSEDILMEHAANSIASNIERNFKEKQSVLIVSGPGNNGADGIALARLLYGKYDVNLAIPFGAKSPMAKLQLQRARLLGVKEVNTLVQCDVIVDSLFGSGLNKPLDESSVKVINGLNSLNGYKIACDIPSGINNDGQISPICFKADITITMGALKSALFNDEVKDFTGVIAIANLGVQRSVYEAKTDMFLLEKGDLKLPFREKLNSHKGDFGHLSVILGDKKGAGLLAADAGFAFGVGLVSVIAHEELNLPYHIMQSHSLPLNTTAIAIGMGLGKYDDKEIKDILQQDTPKVIDADLCYDKNILEILNNKNIVITPHPKEFCSLLKLTDTADIRVEVLQKNRFEYLKIFSSKFPNLVVLLKGANTLIAQNGIIYINHIGRPVISQGGSGDVLTGLIGSLLAQKYEPLEAAIQASLAHTIASKNFKLNNYAMKPQDIIEEVKKL